MATAAARTRRMPTPMAHQSDQGRGEPSPSQPDDRFLIAGVVGGDADALRALMHRYDRLVRFTVMKVSGSRCVRDPDWLDTIAGDAWTGFVRSVKRTPDNHPDSIKAYLVQIARYKALSAMRGAQPRVEFLHSSDGDGENVEIESQADDPVSAASRIELLGVLRDCISELADEDRSLADELGLITERRWREAAERLGTSESTLRSRWKRTLSRLSACVEQKTGQNLAPEELGSDF